MKILLLGANGQVGTECQRSLAPLGECVLATRNGVLADGRPCEVADLDQPASLHALVMRVAPDVVVNAAAYTAVDKAESDSDAAFRANAESPAVIAAACRELDAYLVHYSTDYVFDGQGDHPYRPDEATSPLGVYGVSKRDGEVAIRESGCRHAILRTAWVYAHHGKNFMLTMLRLANERDELRVVGDQEGTPTPAALIADVTALIVARANRPTGTWHLTPHGKTTWHGFAEAIIQHGLDSGLLKKQVVVTPIPSTDFPTPAKRPAWSVLDITSLEQDWEVSLPDWRSGLDAAFHALHPRA